VQPSAAETETSLQQLLHPIDVGSWVQEFLLHSCGSESWKKIGLFKGQGRRGLGRGLGCLIWHLHPKSLFPCSAREGRPVSAALWAKSWTGKKTAQRDRTASRQG